MNSSRHSTCLNALNPNHDNVSNQHEPAIEEVLILDNREFSGHCDENSIAQSDSLPVKSVEGETATDGVKIKYEHHRERIFKENEIKLENVDSDGTEGTCMEDKKPNIKIKSDSEFYDIKHSNCLDIESLHCLKDEKIIMDETLVKGEAVEGRFFFLI